MQKLKATVIHNMIRQKLTGAEVNFILHISHYQDDSGRIIGVYYKDISKALKMSYQGFYDVLHGLEGKGIIRLQKNFYTDWDIEIIGNGFGNYKESYINTGHAIFHDMEFLKLKANEKLLAMLMLQYAGANSKAINRESRGKYCAGVSKFYKTFSDLFSVTKRILQRYLCSLKRFFSIGIKDGKYYITPLAGVLKQEYDTTDNEFYTEHIKEVAGRRNGIDLSGMDRQLMEETFYLLKQYSREMKNRVADFFLAAFRRSIQLSNRHVKRKKEWKRELQPKFIHKLMLEEYEHMNTPVLG